ncbi:metal-dependent hydrolase [Pontixanthobacter aestiaquae]|uniref:Metal-dependent hydrolase n=1 Tax=Pontixanthobacter aestiaquae TaxID=1509367 RepID=A0A844Z5I7_9SPHN|nr:metal-dependent hydrolase [Pontixanthobacter aestiaquae]MDN3645820.1 metal-dependent hydrolase [Pontixanthobacter aestiaquae]MXO83185.1 metal-dependent hydrolase [Pontixanthobacter aestiaquae]
MNKQTSIDLERSEPLDKSADKPATGISSSTPEEHALIVRNRRFDREHKTPRHWHSGDPVATAWYNSVSASLPRGEAFFIDTMRMFRDDVPDDIAREMKVFITQEINHTREHVAFNRLVSDHGYNVESIDQGIQAMLELTEGRPKEFNLAITIALEHFAAMISHHLLADPRYLEGADQEAADIWRWHATEEIEHKGITYDVWLHATKDWSRWKRYRVKTLIALLITKKYFGNRIRDAIGLLEQDGFSRRKAKWKLYAFLWWKPGMMRRMFWEWSKILMPGYHPWNLDDRALINKPDSPYADAAMPAE